MTSKQKTLYDLVFSNIMWLLECCIGKIPSPERINSDFEVGLQKSLEKYFPKATISPHQSLVAFCLGIRIEEKGMLNFFKALHSEYENSCPKKEISFRSWRNIFQEKRIEDSNTNFNKVKKFYGYVTKNYFDSHSYLSKFIDYS